jgi:anti-anti-sigma factor
MLYLYNSFSILLFADLATYIFPNVIPGPSTNPIGYTSVDDFNTNAKANSTSVLALIKQRNAIKSEIVRSNALTEITVDGKVYTVAGAIERKNSIGYERELLNRYTFLYKATLDKQEALTKVAQNKLDSLIAPQLKSELVFLNSEGVKNIIFDLSSVKYVDSSGLSAILVGNRLCNAVEGRFVLTQVNQSIAKLIEISQLESILAVAADADAAKAFFN